MPELGDELEDLDLKQAMKAVRPNRMPWLLLVIAIAGALIGGFFLYKDREAARAEAGVASAKAQEALDKLASASSAKGELEQRLDKLESEKADLTALKNELSKDVQAKSDELQKLK